ncbi:MAG: hypothetical protein WCQ26_07695 [Pseudanabaena sp. ELA748]
MKHHALNSTTHSITVELSSHLYDALLKKIKATGKTETDLVVQGLQQILNDDLNEQERFAALETALEEKLKHYVESLIKERLSSTVSMGNSPQSTLDPEQSRQRIMPIPTIRPLQVGDRVLVLEPDSPYYMAKLLVIKTSLIRATVDTDTGEKTFLKRDLRFID